VGVVGPNGAGKTSLLELIHFACLAYSPRTSADPELVRFGCDVLRAEARVELAAGPAETAVGYTPGDPKRATVDGSAVGSIDRLLARFPVLVFTPDRLRLVQGPPALRRAYFDRVLARMWPAQSALASEYGRALVQRNHLLRRIRAGQSPASGLDAWDEMTARAGAALGAARSRLSHALAPRLAERLAALGGVPGDEPLLHVPNTPGGERELRAALAGRRQRDVERAATGAGPHLDDYRMQDAGRDLRRYGSQGEQRRMLLGLILAEADLIERERDEQPLLLLDDVTGEFDAGRRGLLLEAVSRFQQAILTTTDEADLGVGAAVVTVRDGTVTAP
jgi:DNA replication and repair protein RecF